MMKQQLLDTIVCPCCLGKLKLQQQTLICEKEQLAFPMTEGIPVLLKEAARQLNQDITQ